MSQPSADTIFNSINPWVEQQTGQRLSNIEHIVLQACWDDARQTYKEIATQYRYSLSYIQHRVAPCLWRRLSAAAGTKITKNNFKTVLIQQLANADRDRVSSSSAGVEPSPTVLASVLEFPDGPVPPNSAFYVRLLPGEQRYYQALQRPGALLRIKGAWRMGKSSLVNQLMASAQQQGYQTVSLNFQQLERSQLSDLNRLLRWLCTVLSKKLNLPAALDDYWDEDMGLKSSATAYLECHVLKQLEQPLVLALDDVSELFPYTEVSREFFTMLRTWYEYTKSNANWSKLRLILSQSSETYIKLDTNQSPFNVGVRLELKGMSPAKVQELLGRYPLTLSEAQLTQLLTLVGGHPYLIRLAFYHLARQDLTFDQLLATAATHEGVFAHHLQHYLWVLQKQPELAEAIQQVLAAPEPVTLPQMLGFKLQSMGLVTLVQNTAQMSCLLYQDYF
ncbi:MAG: hypothetical protein F6J87_05105 [Spirulina sp. SIO3F2]|nr:hypothetical protein [Spirulina sp. SIO3F2]